MSDVVADESADEPTAESTVDEVPEPTADQVPEPVAEPAPPAEPEPPRVVTRTRRRSASRPAGPPPTVPAPDASGGVVSGNGTSSDTPEMPEDETPSLHVPVKRKGGARKR